MLPNIGFGILILTFLTAGYGVFAVLYGLLVKKGGTIQRDWIESARLATLLTGLLLTFSVLCLLILLVSKDYSVRYVYEVINNRMPFYLRVTALWGGQSGSLLFWAWSMSAFASIVMVRRWKRDIEFLPWVILVCLLTLLFFLGLVIFLENPFIRYWQVPNGDVFSGMFAAAGAIPLQLGDGYGLNPLLRHPGMIFHPPALYLGFVSFVIPYAFAVASLASGRSDDRWLRITRRWSLVAWLFLSLGLILGSRWAYDVLGWGGYWSWDPVEISALMPWLSCTAFLHSVTIQERRGLFKHWNLFLAILTYCLVVFGTFLTRSGVFSSVHTFSESAIGPLFFGFITITFLTSAGLLLWRWNSLKSDSEMPALLSRETLFMLNNFLFMGVLVICFWGVIFPLVSELFTGQKITVGAPFYERAAGPLLAAIVLLMGIAPLAAWGRSSWKTIGRAAWLPLVISLLSLPVAWVAGIHAALVLFATWLVSFSAFLTVFEYTRNVFLRMRNSGENFLNAFLKLAARNRRRYGGYWIHLGIILMSLGIIGMEMLQTQTQALLQPGQSATLDGYTVLFWDVTVTDQPDGVTRVEALLNVSRNGILLGSIVPHLDYYPDMDQTMTIPGIRSTLADDLYVIIANFAQAGGQETQGITFKIYHNPLVNWLWIGTLVLVSGTLVAAWPDRKEETEARE